MIVINLAVAFSSFVPVVGENQKGTGMYDAVRSFLAQREKEFDQIDPERRVLLKSLAAYIQKQNAANKPARILFVCTHNSRRSHLGQIWTAAAAAYYGLADPQVYSGGTQASAFNPRAVAALQRAGIRIDKTTEDENPIYHVRYGHGGRVITAFSKVLSHEPNPKTDFCAIMVCSDADKSCPTVPGATQRIAIPYEDPKRADGTPEEAKTYDERCRQIAREMLYVMWLVKTNG